VQYQFATKRIRGSPFRVPVTVIRWAATVPAPIVPAAIVVSAAATATSPVEDTSSRGRPRASAVRRSDGPKAIAPYANLAGPNVSGGWPKPIRRSSMSGESRLDRSAYSLIVSRSRRRWTDARTMGSASDTKPGLLPVL
jgi:hypothetical protein